MDSKARVECFDFIVVGGGTAGNVVAGRLAENPNVRVLVVEAGIANPLDVPEITTPALAMNLRGSEYDWNYKTTMINRADYERVEIPNTRGKALGGSSSLNYFTWIPGCKETFDAWESFGGPDWKWDPLLPYLRKSATYHDDENLYENKFDHLGSGGPLPISHAHLLPEMSGFRSALTKAWLSRGERISENSFDGEINGLTHCIDSIYRGERSSSVCFLKNKPNITVLPNVRSTKLLIERTTRTCVGVDVIHPKTGREKKFFARYEVILSQGVFETPKLLMLSGIGPKEQLEKFGIEMYVDSPHVGKNLVDHPAVPFVLKVKDGFSMDDTLLRTGPKLQNAAKIYDTNKTGPMGSGCLEMIGFPRIDQYLMQDVTYRRAKEANGGQDPFQPGGTRPHFELDFVCLFGSAFQWHFPQPLEGQYMSVVVDCVRTLSSPGQVTLQSADPLVQPHINLNFFENDLDIIMMREGIRWTYDLLTKGEAFKDLVIGEYPWQMPLDDEQAMKKNILERAQTAFHPTGTARLSKDISQGVVDPQLKVHGIRNLRVIDASVIPVIPDCRIQNSVYMVAEKGADMIKQSHKDLF